MVFAQILTTRGNSLYSQDIFILQGLINEETPDEVPRTHINTEIGATG
jgi:hypothetical protein